MFLKKSMYVEKVFHAYLRRVETMVGNECAHQLTEGLLLIKNKQLGPLRELKRSRDEQVKGLKVEVLDEVVDEVVSQKPTVTTGTTSRKSRRKRKKKNGSRILI